MKKQTLYQILKDQEMMSVDNTPELRQIITTYLNKSKNETLRRAWEGEQTITDRTGELIHEGGWDKYFGLAQFLPKPENPEYNKKVSELEALIPVEFQTGFSNFIDSKKAKILTIFGGLCYVSNVAYGLDKIVTSQLPYVSSDINASLPPEVSYGPQIFAFSLAMFLIGVSGLNLYSRNSVKYVANELDRIINKCKSFEEDKDE